MRSAKQRNRPREPAVAGQGRRRSARRPSLDRAARSRSSKLCPLNSWLQRVRHEKHRRPPTAGLAKEPARVQYSGCGYGRKPRSIQHGRFCPHPAGLRSRPVRQELGATASVRDMVGRFFSYGELKHLRTTELAEHSASRPTDLQIPKATVDRASQRGSRARRALQFSCIDDRSLHRFI
jgi:hypothetical protein